MILSDLNIYAVKFNDLEHAQIKKVVVFVWLNGLVTSAYILHIMSIKWIFLVRQNKQLKDNFELWELETWTGQLL